MMMTGIPPFDDRCVRLGRAAELIARECDDATADDIMDAFKRAIYAGEMDHDSAGLQMEIAVPRCTLPPDVAAMAVRPRALYGVNRCTVASVLLCADALPGERADWERLFDDYRMRAARECFGEGALHFLALFVQFQRLAVARRLGMHGAQGPQPALHFPGQILIGGA